MQTKIATSYGWECCELYRKCSKCEVSLQIGRSFHRFPKPGKTNIIHAKAWAIYCWPEKKSWSLESLLKLHSSHKMLCGAHFRATCFREGSKTKLSKYAVPGDVEYVNKLLTTLRKEMKNNMTENISSVKKEMTPEPEPSTPRNQNENIDSSMEIVEMLQSKQSSFTSDHQNENIDPLDMSEMLQSEQSITISSHQQSEQSPSTSEHQNENKDPLDMSDIFQSEQSITISSNSEHQDENISSVKKETTQPEPVPSTSTNQKCKTSQGLLASINVTRVNNLNEREKILYKQCKRHINQIRRLKRILNKSNRKKADERNLEGKKDFFSLLLQSEMKNNPKKMNAKRYNKDLKIMALAIYKKSPECYRLLRELLAFPSEKTLYYLINKIPLNAGMNENIFKSLKNMTSGQTVQDNIAVLSFDEMTLKNNLSNIEDHAYYGRSNQFASNALVFLVSGIRKKYKQPVAFYFSEESFDSDLLTNLIIEVLTKCEEAGLNIVSTVCDMSAVNKEALEKLGSTAESPYILINDQEIVNIYNPPHLLICTRDTLMNYDVLCQTNVGVDGATVEGVARWSHVRSFYELDKNNTKFVFAPALTEQHLNPKDEQTMSVKLAAQVFSHTVTAGMLAKIASGELPSEAHFTAMFLHKFDNLFDSLNADSRDMRQGKKYSANIKIHSPHSQLFKEMKLFIRNMTYLGSRPTPLSQTGWIHTINAVERLWQNLNIMGIKTLATRKLNKEPLENCFGFIRSHCGSKDNPTIAQFISAIKSEIINNLSVLCLEHTSQKKGEADTASTATSLSDNFKEFFSSDKLDDEGNQD